MNGSRSLTKLITATSLASVICLVMCLAPVSAEAHWCDDLWGSAYNVTVRPEADTVTVPSSGAATLVVYVQNNMGYLLPSF